MNPESPQKKPLSPPSESGASPFIQERCNVITKNQLCESLNIKLERRPGSLELVEKGVLQVDPGVANLIRCGSISYPRVSSSSPTQLFTVPENEPITQPLPPPLSPEISKTPLRGTGSKSRTPSRSLKDETVISRYGSLVFHNYRPSSAASSNSPSLRPDAVPTEHLPRHRAREVQQAELLHLENAAQVHRRLGQEICQLKECPPQKTARTSTEQQLQQTFNQHQLLSPVMAAAQSQPPNSQQQCFVISTPSAQASIQQTPIPVSVALSPQPPPTPSVHGAPPAHLKFSQIFSNPPIFDDGSGTLVTLNNGHQPPQVQQHHQILNLATSPAPVESTAQKVPSLEQIETVWLDLRRLQQEITESQVFLYHLHIWAIAEIEIASLHRKSLLRILFQGEVLIREDRQSEASRYGQNIVSSDGFPGAFCVAIASESEANAPAYQRLRDLSNQHNRLCSLARLLICDRLDYLDQVNPLPPLNGDCSADDHLKQECYDRTDSKGGSELERSLLQSYLSRLGGNYQRFGASHLRRSRQAPNCPPSAGSVAASNSAGSNTPQAFWRNSTILPAHSESVFYQQQPQVQIEQQQQQPLQQKMNGSSVEVPSNADTWVKQFCPLAELQTLATSANPVATMITSPVAGAALLHTTSSMPANLHLVNGATIPESAATATMILSPGIAANAFTAVPDGGDSSFCKSVHVDICATTAGGLFLPSSAGGSSGNSGPVLTAESSSCSIPTVTSLNGHQEGNNLMPMEFSPRILSPPDGDGRSVSPDLSDVQDFLSGLPFDEEDEDLIASVGFDCNSNTTTNSGLTDNSNVQKLPPGPQFFVPPESDPSIWELSGLMDLS
ncbi:hypothetical protein Aperf_G00000016827 [Anoplocephala perfoliata]